MLPFSSPRIFTKQISLQFFSFFFLILRIFSIEERRELWDRFRAMAKEVDPCDHGEVVDAGCVRAVLAELVLTFVFVFTGVAATMAAGKPRRSPPLPSPVD